MHLSIFDIGLRSTTRIIVLLLREWLSSSTKTCAQPYDWKLPPFSAFFITCVLHYRGWIMDLFLLLSPSRCLFYLAGFIDCGHGLLHCFPLHSHMARSTLLNLLKLTIPWWAGRPFLGSIRCIYTSFSWENTENIVSLPISPSSHFYCSFKLPAKS